MKNSILAIGGDLRLSYATAAFLEKGFFAEHIDVENKTLETKIKSADILLLPVPVSTDGKNLNAPISETKLSLSYIAEVAGDKKIIFGGKIPKVFKGKIYDYLEREDFKTLNAVPTAEGTLEIAMRETEHTIAGSRTLVIGFGKIGKMLCKMFSGIGAYVCATARKAQDIALINAYGYESAKTAEIGKIISGFDIIINTVPERVIGDELLLKVKKDSLIIDVASVPGGLDIEKARSIGIKALWALSLPGKVAPKTSGKIICDTVLNILSETGV